MPNMDTQRSFRQQVRMKTFKVGSYHVTRIEEMLTPGFKPEFLFPDYTPEVFGEHAVLSGSRFWDEVSQKVMSSMHSWMIRNDKHTILIDTGCGNDKTRALPLFERFHQLHLPYLSRLSEAGVQPEDVTLVICTHLHIDHVGWNTRLVDGAWVPTFRNAKYIFSRREFAHWQSPTGGHLTMPENIAVIADSVLPVLDAGQVEFIDDGSKIVEGLFFHDAIGHTAGHGMLKLESGNDAAIFPGDSLHQPMQVFRPDWNSRFCEQPVQARATRRSILDYCHDRHALLLPAHFGAPHGGYVSRHASGYDFTPADELVVAR
jgi:glyoxylase-like metal-dependent hydrolase (beta-lactamase superfamily II)